MEDREGNNHGGSSDSEQEEVVAEPTSIGTLKKEKEVRAGGHDDGSSSESEVEERRERRDPPVEERPPATTPRTSSFEASTPRDRSASDVHSGSVVSKSEFSLDDSWWIDYDELELEDKVSESATATVYHGEYRGQEVAVKIFNPEMINREKLVKEFQMISSIRSPHVVVFYGLCLEPHIAVVMEKCGYGSLDEVLANHTDRQFDWNRFFSLAEGLIGGLNTFHNNKPQILHREIRPQNLLINSDWKLKYADFGRARYNERGDEALKTQTLDSGIENVAYTAPEVYMEGSYSTKSDIYSVGFVIWELALRIVKGDHEPPYQDLVKQGLNSFQILRKTCMTGLRPDIPDKMPAAIKELITTCWSDNPDQRLSAKDLWKKVVDLRKDFRKAPNNWFVAKADQEEEDDEDENSSELVSPRGSMGGHRNLARSGDSDESPIVLDVSSPRRTPRGGYGSLKKGQWQASEKETEAKFLSEVEKRVEERLKQQEEAMRSELMQQFKRTSVMTDKEKVLAEIDPKQVVKHFSVGKGAFGEVFKGLLHGKEVAIKQLYVKDKLNDELLNEFRTEVQIMITLRHPNICLMMGACTQPENLMIIMEYMHNGSVDGLIHGKKKNFLSLEQRVHMARDCALGMNWLHQMNPPFLHLDLKPANLLVDKNWNVKVADFGLSKIQSGKDDDGMAGGSPFYMAPEVLLGRGCDAKADVYSFGILLWEMYTREKPWHDMFEDEDELIAAVCDEEERPKIPADCPPALRDLIESCWHPDPEKRPTFQAMLEKMMFEKVLIEHTLHEATGRDFWIKYFLTQTKVEWIEFWTCMISYLKVPHHQILPDLDPKLAAFKKLLSDEYSEDEAKERLVNPIVTRENFAKFLRYFGPFNYAMLERFHDLTTKPWWHGDISKKKAESYLAKAKKTGRWLVRYSTFPGDFIVSVVTIKKKQITFQHFIISNIEAPDGKLVLLLPPKDYKKELNLSLPEDRKELLALGTLPTFGSIAEAIKAKRKELGIKNTTKFVERTKTNAPVVMPALTKVKLNGKGSGVFQRGGKK